MHQDLALFEVMRPGEGPDACRHRRRARRFRACVDADKVQQMLHNVVSNAVKYTPARGTGARVAGGAVRPRARPGPAPGPPPRPGLDAFTLVVEDSGMGMSERVPAAPLRALQPRRPRRGPASLPGAGLGLHITRGLVEAHGGEIRLTASPAAAPRSGCCCRVSRLGAVLTVAASWPAMQRACPPRWWRSTCGAARPIRPTVRPGRLDQAPGPTSDQRRPSRRAGRMGALDAEAANGGPT